MASYMLHTTAKGDRDFIVGSFHNVVRIAARIVITRASCDLFISDYTLRDCNNKIMRRFTAANVYKLAGIRR